MMMIILEKVFFQVKGPPNVFFGDGSTKKLCTVSIYELFCFRNNTKSRNSYQFLRKTATEKPITAPTVVGFYFVITIFVLLEIFLQNFRANTKCISCLKKHLLL